MTGKLNRKNGSREPTVLSDSDIMSNTECYGTSTYELRDADLTVVTGGWIRLPGSGFPIGQVYKPVIVIRTR